MALLAMVPIGFSVSPAAAEQQVPAVRAGASVRVIGKDLALPISGSLGPGCAGQVVEAGLFVRDRADPKLITPFGSPAATPASTAVNSDGTFTASIPLPRELPGGPTRVWPGVQGSCLEAPVVDDLLGVELAVLDPARNPGNTSTILLSPEALASVSNGPDRTPLGAFLGSVTVLADGQPCASVTTDGVTAGSLPPVLRLGEPGQPAACAKPGAHLTFINKRGQQLYVEMELIPGATRLLDNFAVAPPGTGEPSPVGDAPGPPATGQLSGGESRGSAPLRLAGAGLVALAALLGALGFAVRHRA